MNCNSLNLLVGETGIEPATPCSQGRCATRLRYSPTKDETCTMAKATKARQKWHTYPFLPLFFVYTIIN